MEGIGVNANAVQSDLRDLNGRIQTFNEKNRKLREQISKDETSAAADAQRQITALTQEGVEKRAKIMRDALLGGMSRDYGLFETNVIKVWDDIGKKIEQQQAPINRMFATLNREIASAGGDRFDAMLFDFKRLSPDSDQLQKFKDLIDQARNQGEIGRFTAADNLPPLSNTANDDRLPAFLKPGSADAARLQFNLGQDSYQRQRDEVQKQQLEEAKKHTELLEQLSDGTKFTILDSF
jgi:hypothetical protein